MKSKNYKDKNNANVTLLEKLQTDTNRVVPKQKIGELKESD
jgi:hypothetical protein